MELFGFLHFIQESAYDLPHPSPLDFDLSYYLLLIVMVALFTVSVRKIMRNKKVTNYKKMRCPKCGEEPFRLFKLKSNVSFQERVRGFTHCANCDAYLRMYLPNSFWGALLILAALYLILTVPFLIGPDFYMKDSAIYFYLAIGLIGSIAMIGMFIATAFTIRFAEAEE